ncbi:MAG: hypothetical protein DWQ34_04155 [Planctomycetota bacterium]|nr:MAG: hypothetical protein DWQ29_18035 [Planctomycetota bacterium]REJ96436.1 MAG: hypothetical protein DWQ34_04155 [Planctomycetota bacterium]REK29707.1 MAG: hypothetical protein DWQ41_03460 [Planctomycetota bacterium]REK30472.1 MAG: hypothetical protein DWQ45_21575 [Planctomycetota bacterium]
MCFCRRAVFIATLAVLSGCQSGAEAPTYQEDLAPVSGIVTIDGEPAASVDILFTPVDDKRSVAGQRRASGQTGADGRYTLYSLPGGQVADMEQFSGVIPGDYKVTFSKFTMPDGTVWDSQSSDKGPMAVGAVESIPLKYTNPLTSEFRVSIPESGGSEFDFELESE